MNEDTKTIKFKCEHCGFTWENKFPKAAMVQSRQRCPNCKKYSDDSVQFDNPWEVFNKGK